MTQQEKYDILTQDFLERDGHFVSQRTTDRLGWEDTLPQDSAYSAVILKPKNDEELFRNAVKIARQMIVSMNSPFKISVKVNADGSYTDSHTVYLESKVLDDKALDLGKRLDVFVGLAIHEGSHLLYTDFDVPKQKKPGRLLHHIWNILEDEYIERTLGQENPGLVNFLKSVKYYYFDKFLEQIEEKELSSGEKLLNTILTMVRYPASMNKEWIMEFADELLEVRKILTPYPSSTIECYECAEKILDIVKNYIEEMPEDLLDLLQQLLGNESQGDRDGESQENQSNGKNQGGGKGKKQIIVMVQNENQDDDNSSDGENSDGQGDGQGNGQGTGPKGESRNNKGNGKGQKKTVKLTPEQMEKILEKVLKGLDDLAKDAERPMKNPLKKEDMCEAAKRNNQVLARECEGQLEIGQTQGVCLYDRPECKTAYEESRKRVAPFISAIRKALSEHGVDFTYNLPGMRTGMLDTNRLAEIRQGVQNVYIRQNRVKTDKINVALVIDESGSMDGFRSALARDTAVLINEAVAGLQTVNLFVYGYTSGYDSDVAIHKYHEAGERESKYKIGSISSYGGTPTGEAIMECVHRIRRRSQDKTLLFVVSDGFPNSERYVKTAVNDVEKKNTKVIGVTINSMSLSEQQMKQMYNQYIVIDDVRQLAMRLGNIVKKTIMKTSKKSA